MALSMAGRFIFIHIPKTGGESVLESLSERKADLWLNQHKQYARPIVIFHPAFAKHKTLKEVERLIPEASRASILAAVRNPFERIYSFYKHLQRWRYDSRFNNDLPRPQIAAAFASCYEFNDWIGFVFSSDFPSLEAARQTDPVDHFMPMSDFLATDYEASRITTMRFENLTEDYKVWAATNSISVLPLQYRNQSRGESRKYREVYGADGRAIVESFYKEDLDRYEYEF